MKISYLSFDVKVQAAAYISQRFMFQKGGERNT